MDGPPRSEFKKKKRRGGRSSDGQRRRKEWYYASVLAARAPPPPAPARTEQARAEQILDDAADDETAGERRVLGDKERAAEQREADLRRREIELEQHAQAVKRAEQSALAGLRHVRERRLALQEDRERARREVREDQYAGAQIRFGAEGVADESSAIMNHVAGTLTKAARRVDALPCDDNSIARAVKRQVAFELVSLKVDVLGRASKRFDVLEDHLDKVREAHHALNPELMGIPQGPLVDGRPFCVPRKSNNWNFPTRQGGFFPTRQ